MRVELCSQASVKQVYLAQCCGDLVSLVVQLFLFFLCCLTFFTQRLAVGGVTSIFFSMKQTVKI